MPYIGNELATQFQAFVTQTITGDGSTGYTLDRAVANGKELLVYINNVKQEEGSGKSYTASGTTITFSAAVASTDSCYVVFLGSAVQTVTPPDGSLASYTGNASISGTLGVTGAVTANAGVTVDNITIDGTEIDLSSGDLTIDVAGDIKLDANGQQIFFAKNGTTFGQVQTEATPANLTFESAISDGDIIFKGSDGGSGIEAMRIDMSEGGRVGIGTTSPATLLHVEDSSGNGSLQLTSSTSGTSFINMGDTGDADRGQISYINSSDDMAFKTGGDERMRLTSVGRINANTGVDTSTAFRFFAPSGQATKVAEFAVQSGVGCHLPVNSTAFTASSDETLKENIIEFNKQESYDNIKNLRAVTFNYKDWTLNGINYQDDKKRIGFIAQDWQTNYPEVIDKDQNDKLCMKYTETIPVLLSALQKAQENIEALEAEIDTLKEKVKALESK
tara:strand:- start:167 stop:1507 length:1341 start_codon:yes stop_codon:yes gene_type:complete